MPKRLPLGSIVAYWEKESQDPVTGADGVLYRHYRVSRVSDWAAEDLANAWGPDWRKHSPYAEFVLEARYIRRGVEEPWVPFQSVNTYEQVFDHVDSRSVFLCPVLCGIADKCQEAVELAKKQEEAKRVEREEVQVQARKKKASEAAFARMLDSPKFRVCALHWNDCMARNKDKASIVLHDVKAMAAYQAVMDATTIPAKAKAIKAFFVEAERLGFE